jgi:hypothetical protein
MSSISRDEKLRCILEKLDLHQDAVRQNMVFLVAKQKERLIEEAKESLRLESERTGHLSQGYDKDVDAPSEQEIRDLLERVRVPVQADEDLSKYEHNEGDLVLENPSNVGGTTDAEGDAEMGGTENLSREALIRAALDVDLRNLVLRAATEMRNYDIHAEQTKDHYRQALLRSATSGWSNILSTEATSPVGSLVSSGGPSTSSKGGILANKNAEIFIDTEALARMDMEPSSSPVQARRTSVDFMKNSRRR